MTDPRLVGRPGSVNEALLDRAIRHAIFLERLKTQQRTQALRLLNQEVIPDIRRTLQVRLARITTRGFDRGPHTTRRLAQLVEGLDTIVTEGVRETRSRLLKELRAVGKSEASFAARAMSDALPLDFEFDLPSPKLLNSILTTRPFEGALLRDWFDGVDRNAKLGIRRQLQIGMVRGEGTDAIVRRIAGTRGVLSRTRRDIETLVRTSINHVSTHAREATYAENADLIAGVRIVATLDHRTSDECRVRDGRVMPVGQGERPPFHMQCRTTTTPVLKSAAELGIPGLENLPPATRASINGQVPADVTWPQWIRRQDAATQDLALGRERGRLLRAGKVDVPDFNTRDGRRLTLDELRRKEGLAA